MTLDNLIEHLKALRQVHGGTIEVMLGQAHPENEKLWSGLAMTVEMIRESVDSVSYTSVPGHEYKAGWIWFQIPDGGIQHRRLSSHK